MATVNDSLIPQKSKNVYYRKGIDGKIVILHFDNDECFFSLDGVSAEFWLLIDGKATIKRIREQLEKKFPDSEIDFGSSFPKLYKSLLSAGLIENVAA